MIQHAYGWTDQEILDLTIPRIAQCVRRISDREHLKFRREAILLQTATRYIAAFGSFSQDAAAEAMKIKLIDANEDDTPPTGSTSTPQPSQSDVVLDESERKVVPVAPAEDKNTTGSFERLMGTFGRTAGSG